MSGITVGSNLESVKLFLAAPLTALILLVRRCSVYARFPQRASSFLHSCISFPRDAIVSRRFEFKLSFIQTEISRFNSLTAILTHFSEMS